MAVMTATTSSKLAYASIAGTASRPDKVSIRLEDQGGTLYIEKTRINPTTAHGATPAPSTPASATTSFFIKDVEVFSTDLVAGECIAVIAASSEQVRITGEPGGIYGS